MAEILGGATHIPCTSGGLPERSWAERIPAAIAKAEGVLSTLRYVPVMVGEDKHYVTAGELALAKALWEVHIGQYTSKDCSVCAALRAFTEKVEAL